MSSNLCYGFLAEGSPIQHLARREHLYTNKSLKDVYLIDTTTIPDS